MKLPNREQAFVPQPKLLGYLLSETHPTGKAKARFFRAIGFDEATVTELEQGLLKIAHVHEVVEEQRTPYGTKYVIEGQVVAPIGRVVTLTTIWIIDSDEERPRFVTAYPT